MTVFLRLVTTDSDSTAGAARPGVGRRGGRVAPGNAATGRRDISVETPPGRRSDRYPTSTRRQRGDHGFGLMEVLIALSLLLVIILPMSYLLGTVLTQSTNTKASVAAGLIAEQELEESHAVLSAAMTAGASSVCTPTGGAGPNLPCTIPEGNQSVQGFNYSISLYFQWTAISGTANVCKSGVIPQVVLAQVTVSWGPTLQSVSESSVINLPYIASNPTNGFLAVQVSNAAGRGTKGVLVTAATTSPSYSTTALTDSHGCAFITVPSASPGYTVSLSPPTSTPGVVYVDQTDNPSPSLTNQAVSAQGITTLAFNYDKAATVNLNYPSVTGVADGITCPTTSFCIATGQNQTTTTSGTNLTNGTPTAEILATTDGTNWATATVPGLARLLGISCTGAGTTTCEGVGTSTTGTGIAFGVTISSGSWTITNQTLPAGLATSQLSSVACTSATSCWAVGYGVTGGTRTGVMLSYNGTTWTQVTTSGVELISSIACPTSATCVLTANNTTAPVPAPVVYTFNTSTSAFASVTLTPAASTLSQVTCGSSVAGLCILTGTVGANAEAWVSTTNGSTWTAVTGIPTGASTLGTPVCTGPTSCLVTDNTPATTSGQMLVITGTPSGAPTGWAATAGSVPAGIQSLSDLACQSTSCLASGQISGSPGQGVLLTSTNNGSTWTTTSLPGTTTPTFLTGVGCLATACVASGEANTADLLYGEPSGSWASDTVPADPTGTTGLLGAGWSATVGNTNFNYGFLEVDPAASPATASSPNPTTLTPLFPSTLGYTVWPGGCPAENSTPPTVAVTPAGTSSVTVALAPIALKIVDGTGQPVPGATITLAQNNATSARCPAETFALPTTNGDGLSRAGFSYGIYTATITNPLDSKTTTAAITIGASSVTSGTTTYPEPDPVVVKVS